MMAGMSAGGLRLFMSLLAVILCRRRSAFVFMWMRCGRFSGDSLRGMEDRLQVAAVVMGHMRMMGMRVMSGVDFI